MMCHQSTPILDDLFDIGLISTGQFFSESLFEAAFALEKSDFVLTPPGTEAYLKIAKALLARDPKIGACRELTLDQLEMLSASDNTLNDEVAILSLANIDYTDSD